MADDIERLAMEELLRETKRAKERANVMGAMGWKKGIASANKTFLANTLVSTLRDYRHLDRDRKQHPPKEPSPEDDRKESRRQSDIGKRKHSPEHRRKSESKAQDDRGDRKRRKESPERKHRKRSFEDRRGRSSVDRERNDAKKPSQKFDRKDSKKERKTSSDGELSDLQKGNIPLNSELFNIDLASIPLPEGKGTVDKQIDSKEAISTKDKLSIQEENVKGTDLQLPSNENKKDIGEIENSIVREQRNTEIERSYPEKCNGNDENEISNVVEVKDVQVESNNSVVEKDIIVDVHNVRILELDNTKYDEDIHKKKKNNNSSKSHSNAEGNKDSKSSHKHRKSEKHRRQKEMKKGKHEKCHNDGADKMSKEKEKMKYKANESDSDFNHDEKAGKDKNKDFIERKDSILENKNKLDKSEKRKYIEKGKMKDQKFTDVYDSDYKRRSKSSDSESEKQEKRKRKKEKSGHHHKHKKHKKDYK